MSDLQFQTVGRKFLLNLIDKLKERGATIVTDKIDQAITAYQFKTKSTIEPTEMIFAYVEDYKYYVRKYLTRC